MVKIRAGKVDGSHLWEGIEFELGLLEKALVARRQLSKDEKDWRERGMQIAWKRTPSRGTSQCKGPEAGTWLNCCKNNKETSEVRE